MVVVTGELLLTGISLSIGKFQILQDVDVSVEPGSLHALVGPNGAGKTSLLNCISGFYRPTSGQITLDGRRLDLLRPDQVARAGIGRVFQNVELFRSSTVLENLMLGRHRLMTSTIVTDMLRLPRTRREEVAHRRHVEELIDFLDLEEYRYAVTAELPYGVQKRVELGRALAIEPTCLLLDEPVAGMNPEEKEDMARYILEIRRTRDVSIVMIDHDMRFVMDLASTVSVLNFGRLLTAGSPDQVMHHPQVIEAYLGTVAAQAGRPPEQAVPDGQAVVG